MNWKTLVILIISVLVYILVGAAIFLALEQHHETRVKEIAQSTFMAFTGWYKLRRNGCRYPA